MEPIWRFRWHISIIREDLMEFLHTHGASAGFVCRQTAGRRAFHASHLFLPDNLVPDIEATNFAFRPPEFPLYGEFQVQRQSRRDAIYGKVE